MKILKYEKWIKILLIVVAVAVVVYNSDIQINGVKYGLESLLTSYAELVIIILVVGSTEKT